MDKILILQYVFVDRLFMYIFDPYVFIIYCLYFISPNYFINNNTVVKQISVGDWTSRVQTLPKPIDDL